MSSTAGTTAPSTTSTELRAGFIDIMPVLVAAMPIGLLWGTLAVGKGLTPLEASIMSAAVFAGAAQFIALEVWGQPAPWVVLGITALIVNLRHVLMGASLARHFGAIPRRLQLPLMWFMADENWALAERRALERPVTLPYYLGLTVPMVTVWIAELFDRRVRGPRLRAARGAGLRFRVLGHVHRHRGRLRAHGPDGCRSGRQCHRLGRRQGVHRGAVVHPHRRAHRRRGGGSTLEAGAAVSLDPATILAIVAMALATGFTRLAGWFLTGLLGVGAVLSQPTGLLRP